MTATTTFGYRNRIDDATLSGGAWDDLELLQGGHLWTPATADDATEASTRIDMDFGAAIALRVLWIPASNLTAAATVQATFGTTSGASDVADSGTLAAFPFTSPFGHDPRRFGIPIVMPADATARYCRLQITDTANPADPWISRPFVGSVFLPWINPVQLERPWMPSYSSVRRTVTGVDWRLQRRPLRSAAMAFNGMTEAESSLFTEIVAAHDTTQEVLYIESTLDRARQQQYGFLGLMRELQKTEYSFWKHDAFAVAIDERGGAPA